MESLSTLMLAFIVMLLCLAVPRMFADWLSLRKLEQSDDFDELEKLLTSANFWTQRHFWCALMAAGMAAVIDNSALETMDPHLVRMTAAYAALSLACAMGEALCAQKITVMLAARRVAVKSRRNDDY